MYFFTADEHYNHKNIIKYCDRPFSSIEEMNKELINRHNEVVSANDCVIHAGDFGFFSSEREVNEYLRKLNGNHILLRGSHDKWMNSRYHEIWTKTIDGVKIVVCHYSMKTWPSSHYNAWQLYGHSHGRLTSIGKQMDVGVDTNNYYPYSFEDIKGIMEYKPDNPNLVR